MIAPPIPDAVMQRIDAKVEVNDWILHAYITRYPGASAWWTCTLAAGDRCVAMAGGRTALAALFGAVGATSVL